MPLLLPSRDTFLVRQNVVILVHEGERGRVLREIRTHNLVPDTGLDQFADIVRYAHNGFPANGANPQYIAVGNGTAAAAASDTILGSEVYRGEISYRYYQTNGIQWELFLGTEYANYYFLTEAGLFSAPSGGNLWGRTIYDPIEKMPSVSVTYQWTWTVSNA